MAAVALRRVCRRSGLPRAWRQLAGQGQPDGPGAPQGAPVALHAGGASSSRGSRRPETAPLWALSAAAAAALGAAASSRVECEEHVRVMSQEHLLHPSVHNPTPTMVPPPVEGLTGGSMSTKRSRLVSVITGLPLGGQSHIAVKLQRYLSFFHGSHVELFNVNQYAGPTGQDNNQGTIGQV